MGLVGKSYPLTEGEKKDKLWLFSKVELLIFSSCSFCIFMLLSTKSYIIISILSVATQPKDKLAWGGDRKFMQLNSFESQNDDSAKAKESIHSWDLIQNIYGLGIII